MVPPSPHRGRPRRAGLLLAAVVCALAVFPAITIGAHTRTAEPPTKVRICHATSSESNPFVENEPAIGNNGDLNGGHLDHDDDIIPPYTYVDKNGDTQAYPGKNWDDEGQAIWENGCKPVVPPEPPKPRPISPYVQCIEPHGSGFLAHFGYDNPNDGPVTPPSDENAFDPPPPGRGQPTTFEKGRHDDAVAADFSGSLSWKLTDREATANESSPRCQGSITVFKHLVPADDTGRFDLKIDGQVEGTGAAVGDQGTTGTIAVDAGPHTVSESGAAGTSLADYTIETVCRDDDTVVASSSGPTVDLTVGRGQAITCVIENTATPKQKTVSPVLECVLFGDSQADVAYWGYNNTNGHEVTIQVGAQNEFSPDPAKRNQPTTFSEGRRVGVFQTPFDASAGNLVWHLSGKTATASSGSKACNPTVELRKVTVPADDPGVFQLRINNAVVATGGNGTTSGPLRTGIGEGTVSETASAGTNLADYDSKVECTRNGKVDVSVAGTKVDGKVAQGDVVVCTFTNTRNGPTPPTPPTPPNPPTPPPVPPPPPGPLPILDLVVTKTVRPTTVAVGGRLTWTMTVRNRSSVAAADVNGLKVNDRRAPRTRLVSLKASQGSCAAFTCNLGRLAPGASARVVAVTEATRVGNAVDIVRVGSEEPESNYRNNVAAALARVIGPLEPPVALGRCDTLTVAPRVLQSGRSSVVLLTARNRRGQPLAGVRVRVRGPGVDRSVTTDREGTVRGTVLPSFVGLVFFTGTPRTLAGGGSRCRTMLGVLGASDTRVTG